MPDSISRAGPSFGAIFKRIDWGRIFNGELFKGVAATAVLGGILSKVSFKGFRQGLIVSALAAAIGFGAIGVYGQYPGAKTAAQQDEPQPAAST